VPVDRERVRRGTLAVSVARAIPHTGWACHLRHSLTLQWRALKYTHIYTYTVAEKGTLSANRVAIMMHGDVPRSEMLWKKRSARSHTTTHTHTHAYIAPTRPHETLYFCLPNGRIRWRAVSEAAWRVHSFCKHLRPLYAPSDNPNT